MDDRACFRAVTSRARSRGGRASRAATTACYAAAEVGDSPNFTNTTASELGTAIFFLPTSKCAPKCRNQRQPFIVAGLKSRTKKWRTDAQSVAIACAGSPRTKSPKSEGHASGSPIGPHPPPGRRIWLAGFSESMRRRKVVDFRRRLFPVALHGWLRVRRGCDFPVGGLWIDDLRDDY